MIDMDGNKVNKFLLITTILSVSVLLISATFSYFTVNNRSKLNAVSVEAGRLQLGLGVSDMTSGIKLIPTRDEDIMTAYLHNCIDDNGFGACNIFDFTLSNFSYEQDVVGKISFTINNIKHLSYMVIDDNDNIYLDKMNIDANNSNNLSLGEHFVINAGSEAIPTTRRFKLVVWLSNIDEPQDKEDAGGSYTATVTYSSVDGSMLTGTVNGVRGNGD